MDKYSTVDSNLIGFRGTKSLTPLGTVTVGRQPRRPNPGRTLYTMCDSCVGGATNPVALAESRFPQVRYADSEPQAQARGPSAAGCHRACARCSDNRYGVRQTALELQIEDEIVNLDGAADGRDDVYAQARRETDEIAGNQSLLRSFVRAAKLPIRLGP